MKKWKTIILVALAAALTLPAVAQTETEPVPVPVPQPEFVNRPLATPRLAIARNPSFPVITDAASVVDGIVHCPVIGAAENFARGNARILVRPGTAIRFVVPHAEGVFYERACGWMALFARFDVRTPDGEWRHLDSYFRHIRACGPQRVHAKNLEVHYLALDPGEYLVRTRLTSYALPLRPDLAFDRTFMHCLGVDTDMIFTKVRVVDFPTPGDIEWEEAEPVDTSDDSVEIP